MLPTMWPDENGSTPTVMGRGARPNASAPRVFAVVFAAYVLGAAVSALAFGSTTASAFFVPGGITVAALLLTRPAVWPAIVLAIVAAEFLVDRVSGLTWAVSAGFVLGNVMEATVGAALVRAICRSTPDLRRTRDLTVYVLGAAGAGALSGALVGGTTKWLAFGVPWIQGVAQWFAGDAISVLVVGTSILLWRKQSVILKSRPLETLVILASAAAASVVGFSTQMPPGTTVLPVLAVAALRLGMLGTALTGVVVAAIGNFLTGTHQGLIGGADTTDPIRVAMAQLFVGVLVLTATVIAQEVANRTSAIRERDAERGQRLRLESLSVLAQHLSAALTPLDVGRTLERRLPHDLGVTSFSLGLVDDEDGRLNWLVAIGDPPLMPADSADGLSLNEPCIVTEAVQSATPVIVTSADDASPRQGLGPHWSRDGSLVAWPLFSGERPTGVLLMGCMQQRPFDTEQLTYISAVAAMVGEALVRSQSYADEHARAAVLHSALHPVSALKPVAIEYNVCFEPADTAHGLGGDWFDVMPLPKSRTYLAVGDILGHGLRAVEDMAQLRSAGRTLAHRGQSPAQVLSDLNLFAADVVRCEFATMVIAVFDHVAGSLTYSSAGHPPAFLRRASTGEVIRLIDPAGPLLGPLEAATFVDNIIDVDSGDVLMMYTDGLVERPDGTVEDGISRAETLVAAWSADDLLNCAAVAATLAPPPRADDVCVLAVRFD